LRLANGLHNYVIGRSLEDSTVILIALKADDLAKAKAFAKNPALKKAMEQAGVKGAPSIMFLNSIYQNTADVNSDIRSMSIMTVKDRDAWFKSFEEFKQEREDNGIADRVISQDPDNDKRMILVTAWTDTAKARAYVNSDALKKRREASGVIGTPERFVFQVLKRY
jgi:quinol monooxygenase YgiN